MLNNKPIYLTSVKATDKRGNVYPVNVRVQSGCAVFGYPNKYKAILGLDGGPIITNSDGVELTIPIDEVARINKFCL